MDAYTGDGWYFIDLAPDICNMVIAYYCWINTSSVTLKRTEYYLKWDIDLTLLKNYRKHVYMVPSNKWDKDLIKHLDGGKNKDCPLKPCETCEKGKGYTKNIKLK